MNDVEAIKDRLNIVSLIQEYLPLKKAGANWKANCPFHNEKSPSFMVHEEKQIWHCFGCGKGGDIFSFMQEMEGLDFKEALKILADRSGVKLNTSRTEVNSNQKNRLLEINETAVYFFHRFLLDIGAAAPARRYLSERGLKNETILKWQLGYAPEQWDLLTKYLLKKGFAIDDVVATGLTIRREGATVGGKGYYDRFRGRIMFPIQDVHGNTVGFTGRVVIETEKSGGKYVNTPQTVLYDKSRVIYGLYKAKTAIKQKGMAVLVEGQMDVLSCHQAGMENVVAVSGTALTADQIRLIKRYTGNIRMAFDADAAGENAGMRGVDALLAAGMEAKVIGIPEGLGKDADECLKKNPAAWFKAVDEAKQAMEWYIKIMLKKTDLTNAHQKQAAARFLLEKISLISGSLEQDHWLKELSQALNIDIRLLREEMKRNRLANNVPRRGGQPAPGPAKPVGDMPISRLERLQEAWWSIIAAHPEWYGEARAGLLANIFHNSPYEKLYLFFDEWYTKDGLLNQSAVSSVVVNNRGENQLDVLSLRFAKEYSGLDVMTIKKELEGVAQFMRTEWVKQERERLVQLLSQAEKTNDPQLTKEIFSQLQSI